MFGRKKGPIDSSPLVRDGWRLTCEALEYLARTPDDHEAWVQVAGRWVATAVMPPATIAADGRVPMGFSLRPDGAPQDAAATGRAIADLTRLIDAGVDPAFLLPMRAELAFGWRRYDDAEADWRRAVELIAGDRGRSRERAEYERRIRASAKARAGEPTLSSADLEQVREAAKSLGAHTGNLLYFDPAVLEWAAPGVTPADPDPRLVAAAHELGALGLEALGWYENETLRARYDQRALSGVWLAGTHTAVAAGAMGTAFACDLESQMSDGRHVATSMGRGQNHFLGGPWVDTVFVDATVPLADALALHRARVHALMATTPGLEVVPITGVEDWTAMQEAERRHKLTYRLDTGLSETEARGVPFGPPDVFVPLLQAAARESVASAYAERYPRAA